ncbi:MAG: DUF1571 domain-containing protein [Deltaproteobacteria bacterium]|nr:DUF1571 domain-containing protein [Deltaproteobacteria bacterium]
MIAAVLVAATLVADGSASDAGAAALIERMVSAWEQATAASYRLRKRERLRGGELVTEEIAVKVQKPGRIYAAAILPRRGQEILYDPTKDPTHFWVHPGRFPDVTLHLEVTGALATKRQHHLVTRIGFDYPIAGLSRTAFRLLAAPERGAVSVAGEVVLAGGVADVVVLAPAPAAPRQVVASTGETLWAFADRVGTDAYVIFCANPELDSLTDRLRHQSYRVPASYGGKTELALDRQTGLPARVITYDQGGALYEHYEYLDLVLNPPLANADFDRHNPAYDF